MSSSDPTLLLQHVPMLLDYFALWQMISFIMDNQHCYTLIRLSSLVHSLVRRSMIKLMHCGNSRRTRRKRENQA